MRRRLLALLVVMGGLFGVLFCNTNAFAVVDESVVMEKWYLTELYNQCASEMKTPITSEAINSDKNGLVKEDLFNKKGSLKLPAYEFGGVKNSKKTINCYEMFVGSENSGSGLLDLSKMSGFSSVKWGDTESYNFMTNMGYKRSDDGSIIIQIKVGRNGELVPLNGSVIYKNGTYSKGSGAGGTSRYSVDVKDNKIIVEEKSGFGPYGNGCYGYGDNFKKAEIPIGAKLEDTLYNIEENLKTLKGKFICNNYGGSTNLDENYEFPSKGFVDLIVGGDYKFNNIDTAIKKLSGFGKVSDIKWTNAERYTVYQHYLRKASSDIACDLDSGDIAKHMKKVTLKYGEKMNENCYVSFNGHDPSEYPVAIQSTTSYAIKGSNKSKKSTVTLQTIINWLNKNAKNINPSDVLGLDEIKDDEAGSTDEAKKAKDTCANSGAAGSLGWIVCPALELMANAAQMLYTDYVEPALQVSPKLFNGDKDSGTRYAWGIFQGVANTIFIVMLLVIIFSQLTGMGIDNYGIKKILPKLIIAAVLINLSYLICVLAVDLSNMIGNGIQQLFNMYKGAEHVSIAVNGTTVDVGNIGVTALTGAVILAALFAGIWSAVSQGGGPALILALVVAALTIVVSILTLFLLLAAREAAIVVLTVASPVAFACYMLPNTKSVFDKWFKFMKALLLLYPICGLLVGGGNFVSKLLLSSGAGENGFFSAFMAMVIGVAPIFFIPSAIRGSMSALGKIGEGINKFTAGAKSRAMGGVSALDKGVRNTERFKNHAAEFDRKKLLWANGRRNKRLSAKKSLSKSQERMLARSRAQLLKQYKEDAEIENLAGEGFEASRAGVEAKADADRVSNAEAMLNYGKVEGVNANDPKSMSGYLQKALTDYRRAVENKDEHGKNNALARIKAAQNIMTKTDAGRGQIQSVYEDALEKGNTVGLDEAASHLMSNYGDKYKTVNRGFNQMISDLSTGADASSVALKVENGTYKKCGWDKYTEETLAGADTKALDDLVGSLGSMKSEERQTIQATARRALQKMETGNLNVKPEVAKKLERIVNDTSQQNQMHDAWRDSQGDFPIDHGGGDGGGSRIGGMYGGYGS